MSENQKSVRIGKKSVRTEKKIKTAVGVPAAYGALLGMRLGSSSALRRRLRKAGKTLAVLLCAVLTVSFLSGNRSGALKSSGRIVEGPGVYAEGYVVVDLTRDQVIAEKNMEKHFAPASYNKLVTALVVMEHVTDLNAEMTFSKAALESLTDQDSRLYPPAVEGETITVKDALYGLVMSSSNECANQLALYISGSIDGFVALMNHRMEEMGCRNTHFLNVSGLDVDGQYTCALDMAIFYEEAMKNPDFKALNSALWYNIPANGISEARFLNSGHEMMNGLYDYNDVTSGKAGYTDAAGKVVLTMCERDDYPVLVVLMKSTAKHGYADTETLLEYAYNLHYGWVKEHVYESVHDMCTVNDYVDVHLYENYYSETLSNLTPGAELERTGTWWLWSRVNVGGKTGYVETALLTSVRELEPLPEGETPSYREEESTEESTEEKTESQSEEKSEQESESEKLSSDPTGESQKDPSGEESVSRKEEAELSATPVPTQTPISGEKKGMSDPLRSVIIYGCAIFVLILVEVVMIMYARKNRRS